MPGEVGDKAFDHLVRESTALEETMHVEQVSRVLSVQGGDQFAAVEFRRGEHRSFHLGGKQAAALRRQRHRSHRHERPSEHMVHFDFHLLVSATKKQFRFVALRADRRLGLDPSAVQFISGDLQGRANQAQRRFPLGRVVG